jgi:hypothetical protein
VFRRWVGERIFILLLYVNDILAQVDEKEAEHLREHLRKCFGEVQFEIGSKLSYLGMQVEIWDEGTEVDMNFYVKKLLEGATVKGQSLPGYHNSFVVDDNAQKLRESEKKLFSLHDSEVTVLGEAGQARYTDSGDIPMY